MAGVKPGPRNVRVTPWRRGGRGRWLRASRHDGHPAVSSQRSAVSESREHPEASYKLQAASCEQGGRNRQGRQDRQEAEHQAASIEPGAPSIQHPASSSCPWSPSSSPASPSDSPRSSRACWRRRLGPALATIPPSGDQDLRGSGAFAGWGLEDGAGQVSACRPGQGSGTKPLLPNSRLTTRTGRGTLTLRLAGLPLRLVGVRPQPVAFLLGAW